MRSRKFYSDAGYTRNLEKFYKRYSYLHKTSLPKNLTDNEKGYLLALISIISTTGVTQAETDKRKLDFFNLLYEANTLGDKALFTYYAEQMGKKSAHGSVFVAVGYIDLINDPNCSETIKKEAQKKLEELFKWAIKNHPDTAAHITTLAPQFWTSPLPSGKTFMHYYAKSHIMPKTPPQQIDAEEAVKIAFTQNKQHQTPYSLAAKNNASAPQKFLLHILKPVQTALLEALRENDIKAILELTKNIPMSDLLALPLQEDNLTVFHLGAKYLSLENFKLLLPSLTAPEMVNPLFKTDSRNRRLYHYACENGDTRVLKHLLKITDNIYKIRKRYKASKQESWGNKIDEAIDRASAKTGLDYARVLFQFDFSIPENLEKMKALLTYGADLAATSDTTNKTLALHLLEQNLSTAKVIIHLLKQGKLPSIDSSTLLEMAGYLHKHSKDKNGTEDVTYLSHQALLRHPALQTVSKENTEKEKDKTNALRLLEENPFMAPALVQSLLRQALPGFYKNNKAIHQVIAYLFKHHNESAAYTKEEVRWILMAAITHNKLNNTPLDDDLLTLFHLAAKNLSGKQLEDILPLTDLTYSNPRVFGYINSRSVLIQAWANPDITAIEYIFKLRAYAFEKNKAAKKPDSTINARFSTKENTHARLLFCLDFSNSKLALQKMALVFKQGVNMKQTNGQNKTVIQYLLEQDNYVITDLIRLIREKEISLPSSVLLEIAQQIEPLENRADLSRLALLQWESKEELVKEDDSDNTLVKRLLEENPFLAPHLIALLKEGKLPSVSNHPKAIHQIIVHLLAQHSEQSPYTKQDVLDILFNALKQRHHLAQQPLDKDQMGLFSLAATHLSAEQLAVVFPREEKWRDYTCPRLFKVINGTTTVFLAALNNADADVPAYILRLRADAFKTVGAKKETAKKTSTETMIEEMFDAKGRIYAEGLLGLDTSNPVQAHRKIQSLLEYGADLAEKNTEGKSTAICLLEKDISVARMLINLLKEAKLPALASNPPLLLEIAEYLKAHAQGELFTTEDIVYLADLGLTAVHQQRGLSHSASKVSGNKHENLIHQINTHYEANETLAAIDFQNEQQTRLQLQQLKNIIESDQPDESERRQAFHDYQKAMDKYKAEKDAYDKASLKDKKSLVEPKKPVYAQIQLSENEVSKRRLAALNQLKRKFSEGDAYAQLLLADIYFANRATIVPPQPVREPVVPEKQSWWSRLTAKKKATHSNAPVQPVPVIGSQVDQLQVATQTYENLAREVPEFKAYAEWMLKRIEAKKEKITRDTDITKTATYQALLMAFKLIATEDMQQLAAKQYILDLCQDDTNKLVANTAQLFAAIVLRGGRGQQSDQVDINKSLPLGKEADNAHAKWNQAKAGLAQHVYEQVIRDIGDAMSACEKDIQQRKISDNARATLIEERKEIVQTPAQPVNRTASTVSQPVAIPSNKKSQYPNLNQLLWGSASTSPAALPSAEPHQAAKAPASRMTVSPTQAAKKTVAATSLPNPMLSFMCPKVPTQIPGEEQKASQQTDEYKRKAIHS